MNTPREERAIQHMIKLQGDVLLKIRKPTEAKEFYERVIRPMTEDPTPEK